MGDVSCATQFVLIFFCFYQVFLRLKLPAVRVEADTGMIGGSLSHEYQIPCQIGEDHVLSCPKCGYQANVERATFSPSLAHRGNRV